ncbi:hypothetical protein Syun_012290 [Stephania yunnanensis]|uniref:Uncharacterized protein n=1 Tax=Stephania yunnanensis TaxID=152371 RepID=A0AAP0K1F2_9MAGN
MALEDDIFELMHMCSLSKEEEDEIDIPEEQSVEESEHGKKSLLGPLATIQNFNRGSPIYKSIN